MHFWQAIGKPRGSELVKKQNSMDMEKYNGLTIDVHYLVRQPQINNGIVIINFADNNAFV